MHLDIVEPAATADVAGIVVVVDVLRAFTTAAYALAGGAREIVLVADAGVARRLRDPGRGRVTMGEVDNVRPPDFDLSNSPAEIATAEVAGKSLVHRTTAGTRGVVDAAAQAGEIVAASFVVAEATVAWLRSREAEHATAVVTGAHSGQDGDEDRALAEWLAARLAGDDPAPGPYLERVRESMHGRRFGDPAHPSLPREDLDLACEIDRFDFPLVVDRRGEHPRLLPPAR